MSVSLPGGFGKTTIICSTALGALLASDFEKVHLVSPNKSLSQRDRNETERIYSLSNTTEQIEYHSDLEFEVSDKDLVLVDELDFFMFKQTEHLLKLQGRVIGFSATISDEHQVGYESKIIERMAFREITCWPRNVPKPCDPWIDEEIELPNKDSALLEHLKMCRKEQAVLLYCSQAIF